MFTTEEAEFVTLEIEKLKSLTEVIIDEFEGLKFEPGMYKDVNRVSNLLSLLSDQLDILSSGMDI